MLASQWLRLFKPPRLNRLRRHFKAFGGLTLHGRRLGFGPRRVLIFLFGILGCLIAIPSVHGLWDIRLVSRPPSLHLLDRDYHFIAALGNEKGDFGYWEMPDTLPSNLVVSTLAAEDRRFNRHWGLDWRAVAGALRENLFSWRVRSSGISGSQFGIRGNPIGRHVNQGRAPRRGASTLAMQVARLQHGGTSGWYWKIHDAIVAMGITLRFHREGVLRQYFRWAPYGNRIAGAACASRRYFHKPVEDLSLAEAALLAALPKAPTRFNLFDTAGFHAAQGRARLILRRSCDYGWINSERREESLAELESLRPPNKELRAQTNFHFLRACAANLASVPHPLGEIRTTLNSAMQDTVQSILKRESSRLWEWQARNSAALVLDAKTGEVLAYIGSVDYFDPRGGAIDCARMPRSTGSLLKPFIYALGMEWQGYTGATILSDLGFDFGAGNRSFVPENYDRKFMGPVLYKNALANSRNIPAVEVLKSVGVDLFYRQCVALGLAPDDGKAWYYGLGLSIGGLYCSLQQVSAAYLTLANAGEKRDLVWELDAPKPQVTAELQGSGPKDSGNAVTGVTGRLPHADFSSGSQSHAASPSGTVRRILDPDIARLILRYLSDPVARLPSFPRGGNLEYPFPVAVKTGTSEGYRDSWCVGVSGKYVVGAWMGNVDFSPTKGLSGYSGAAALVKKIFYSLQPEKTDGLSDIEFPPPRGYIPVSICRLTGKRADRNTPYVTTEYFKLGTEPLEYSTVQQTLSVDRRNGLLADPHCRVPVESRRFLVLPTQYHDWAAQQGLQVAPERYSPACDHRPVVDAYSVAITSPRGGSRLFIDPEMPAGQSLLPLTCRVSPEPASVLWRVNGQEYQLTPPPFTLKWPMHPGTFSFQAEIPGTSFRSAVVALTVY